MRNLSPLKRFNIFYEKEASIDHGNQEEKTITSDESSWDREKKLFVVFKGKEEGIVT